MDVDVAYKYKNYSFDFEGKMEGEEKINFKAFFHNVHYHFYPFIVSIYILLYFTYVYFTRLCSG